MAQITRHYGIQEPTEFLDIEVSSDNRKFMDPHAIRLARTPQPFVTRANESTSSFFAEITRCALSSDRGTRARGLDLLQHFEEPWETRLGLAQRGYRGHGGARDVGNWIWDALTTDVEALLRVGVLSQMEDLALFVNGIDRDITSDITTRIIFEQLAEFTTAMMEKYPQFRSNGHHVQTFSRQIWDGRQLEWRQKFVELPIAEGKPLLLVPKTWARPTLLMSAGRYYETSVLTWAQLEQAVRTHEGKLLKTPKDALKNQPGLNRGRSTNLRVTLRAESTGHDLLRYFKDFVDGRYTEPGIDDDSGVGAA